MSYIDEKIYSEDKVLDELLEKFYEEDSMDDELKEELIKYGIDIPDDKSINEFLLDKVCEIYKKLFNPDYYSEMDIRVQTVKLKTLELFRSILLDIKHGL